LPVSFGGEYFFKKNDPATNCHREYTLSCQRTLWAAFCVRRSWGRQGSKRPRSLMQEFEDEATALKYLRWAVARRLRRGYRLVEYRPAEPGNSFTSEG
jgi:predicted DNA-binding WGR domain protein